MRRTILAKGIVVAVLVTFPVACSFLGKDTIVLQGTAMLPSYKDGQLLKVERFDRFEEPDVKRGDVIVFLFPDDPAASYVKRLIGMPGDTVEIREGKVIVNGQELVEPYLDSRLNLSHRSQQPVFVRPNYFYVLGDNRDNSSDSRIWGLVPERYVYAKVVSR
jgi:signal peptidase I